MNVARERYCIVESDIGQLNYEGSTPAHKTLQLDDAYEVSVAPRQPVGTVYYQWYKDRNLLSGATAAKLIIFHVGYEDAGLYEDEIPATVRTRAAELVVVKELPPLFLTGIASMVVLVTLVAGRFRRG